LRGDQWEDESGFTVHELHEIVGHRISFKRLHNVLNGFTQKTLLSGEVKDSQRFYFANNLLPAWTQLQGNAHE